VNLVDTSPLVALIDKDQGKSHLDCMKVVERLTGPMVTTWPCFTEAMYLLGRLQGWYGQNALWQLWDREVLLMHKVNAGEQARMRILMEKYQDRLWIWQMLLWSRRLSI